MHRRSNDISLQESLFRSADAVLRRPLAQKRAWAEGGHQAECRALARLLKAQGRTPPPTLRLLHRVFLRRAPRSPLPAPRSPLGWEREGGEREQYKGI